MTLRAYGARLRVLTAVAGLAAASVAVLAPPAFSVPSATAAACPDVYPISDLTADQPVNGLTVSSGNTPDAFTGQVLGVLTDGIAPGLDMIMVRLTSPEIDRVGGIWAGMSGSPVYASDGRLIGAVAYGLGGSPSPVAGVTPAADMESLVTGTSSTAALRAMDSTRRVTLPKGIQHDVVSDGLATSGQASAGLTRLPLPLSVSGMVNAARLKKAASLMGMSGVDLYRAGSAPADPPATDSIFPGSNLAASMSYGDFSAVGTGTTTMLCGDKVVGFGHPFNWTGSASMTLHGANALYIQDDKVFGPFKVSNTTGPVGTINGDHLAGISGVLGRLPGTTLVRSVVTGAAGNSRTGNTYVSVPSFLPDAAALAELANQDRIFDRVGAGSSLVRFTISGTAAGQPFTLVRTNRFAAPDDISFASVFELADDVQRVLGNPFTDVKISSVRISTQISPRHRVFSVAKVERLVAGHYQTLTSSSVVSAKPGHTLHLRVTLTSPRNRFGSKVLTLAVKVPDVRAGSMGQLTLTSGSQLPSGGRAQSFDGLLTRLADAPRNDQLAGVIDLFTPRGRHVSSHATTGASDVVQGGKSYRIAIG